MEVVGPAGETIIDYSIFDALRAGFGKLVFVIRRDLAVSFREQVGARFENRLPVEYVFQELDKLPAGFAVPLRRKKPWGTAHAVLMGEEVIHEPFAAINGDDFYGADSFRVLARQLQSESTDHAMVGFVLRNTLSEFGSVARGICQVDDHAYLRTVTELTGIERNGHGAGSTTAQGGFQQLTGDEIVSLNMWGFQPSLFPFLRREFGDFLTRPACEENAEFYIPSAVAALIGGGHGRCKVLRSAAAWFGVTYREDRPLVVENIRSLVAQGEYPESLWT